MSLRCDWLDGWWGSKKSQAAQKHMSITKTQQQKRSSIIFYIRLNLIQIDSDLFVLSEYVPFLSLFLFFGRSMRLECHRTSSAKDIEMRSNDVLRQKDQGNSSHE